MLYVERQRAYLPHQGAILKKHCIRYSSLVILGSIQIVFVCKEFSIPSHYTQFASGDRTIIEA